MIIKRTFLSVHELHKNLHAQGVKHDCLEFEQEEKRLIEEALFKEPMNYPLYLGCYRAGSNN